MYEPCRPKVHGDGGGRDDDDDDGERISYIVAWSPKTARTRMQKMSPRSQGRAMLALI